MMTRDIQKSSTKGSKKWIRYLINEKPNLLIFHLKQRLRIPEDDIITWFSPLAEDNYAEYQDQQFLDLLGLKLEKKQLKDFWPRGGPQWDALGKSNLGNFFLVEAKSHIPEMISSLRARNKNSIKKIFESLEETKHFLNAKINVDWTIGFYQYANRLAHLYLLRELNGLSAFLVFVYFVNDDEMGGPSTVDEWKGSINLLHSYLGISRHNLQKFVTRIFIDVKELG